MNNPAHQSTAGRLELICGPMFAGKTTELIRRIEAARAAQEITLAIKPAKDTRYADQELVTHAGDRTRAMAASTATDILAAVGDARVIGIDEAHFFGAELSAVCLALVASGRRVIIVGQEFDHRGDGFEPFPTLLAHAHDTTRITGVCSSCGGVSIHSQRMVTSAERIHVGGIGDYEPRCAACFIPSAR